MRQAEFSSPVFRGKSFTGEIRAAGRYSAEEVRTILAARHDVGEMRDLRLIGCPEAIFVRALERRAAKLGIKHAVTDDERRAKAVQVAAQIAADAEAERILNDNSF